jgi:hypothetical protein
MPISVWPHLGMQFFFFCTSYLQQKIPNKINPDLNSGFPFFFIQFQMSNSTLQFL